MKNLSSPICLQFAHSFKNKSEKPVTLAGEAWGKITNYVLPNTHFILQKPPGPHKYYLCWMQKTELDIIILGWLLIYLVDIYNYDYKCVGLL